MTSRSIARFLALFVVVAAMVFECRAQSPSLNDDNSRLQGEWKTDSKASVQIGIAFFHNKDGFDSLSLDGPKVYILTVMYKLREIEKKRFIEMNESVKFDKLAPLVEYRFEKDDLVLTFGDGKIKGEHRLQKVKSK